MDRRRTEHDFARVPSVDIPRSSFNRSHCVKTTFDEGKLVPFFLDEVLPGDTFDLKATLFARLATPIVPFMDNVYLDTFFFFVPNRLLWEHWQQFCGQRDHPQDDPTRLMIPTLTGGATGPMTVVETGTVLDYLGLPVNVTGLTNVSALPCRAYNLIWNEWFRDENLCDAAEVHFGDGPDHQSHYVLLSRMKRHDYFTSCLPWPQKGTAPAIPIVGNMPIRTTVTPLQSDGKPFEAGTYPAGYYQPLNYGYKTSTPWTNTPMYAYTRTATGVANAAIPIMNVYDPSQLTRGPYIDLRGMFADPTAQAAVTINSFRQAFQLQRLLERDARSGTRYTEVLRAHFGVVSPDARLQRPEYLGGSSSHLMVHAVEQNSQTTATTPQGNLAAFGVFGDTMHGFSKSFVEHGYIIGLLNVRADLTYQQGLRRLWSRRSRFDFYWPALAHLGEQLVLNKEIQASGKPVWDEAGFGYQERWAEYRYFPSQITGYMRSNSKTPLDMWHLAQDFDDGVVLNDVFITEKPPIKRVIAVDKQHHFLFDSYIQLRCTRPMPVYSVPGLIDHF